jgi:hypothetical protein
MSSATPEPTDAPDRVPASTTAAPPELLAQGHRTWSRLDAMHVIGFFADETRQRYKALGIRPTYAYFASRVAPMGAVSAEVCAAAFYVFNPQLVAQALPGAWSVASPEELLRERYAGTREALVRVLEEVAAEPGFSDRLEEAAALARRACEALPLAGRPLGAGYAALPWPDDPLMALWQAAGVLREHRGDGHVAALVHAPLDPVEAILTSGLDTGTTAFMRATRGWDDDAWAAASRRLRERGLVTDGADGEALTEDGVALRRTLEEQTDLAASAAWTALGLDDTVRLGELVRPLTKAVVSSGVLPAGLGAPRR